jgi:hypothetical protein
MRFFAALLRAALVSLHLAAAGQEGAVLDYHLKVRLRDQPAAVESGFRLVTSPALAVRARVKRARFGAWRIEPLAVGGRKPSPALLMQALGLCYFSGPTAQVVPLGQGMTFNHHWCRLWQVQAAPEVGAYAYLAEVAPGLLALAYLSAALPEGDIAAVEIHLASVSLGPGTVPAEEGTALLRTLRIWAAPPGTGGATEAGAGEAEEVP